MLSLRKFDLKNNCWDAATEQSPVVYRNTLLEKLYPNLNIVIGDGSGFIKSEEPDLEGAVAALNAGFEGYRIVGASGSRKKGHALFVKGDDLDCFSRFFGSPSNCINYGSNMVTECKSTFELTVTILVVKDGEFGTGDCHGKCSSKFALDVVGQLQRPFQFRAAVKDEYSWVAKGTIGFAFDTGGYDLVLPESCFKGNKVKPGVYEIPTLYFGVVREAELRHVKMSYSVTQYLPWEAIETDILPGTLAKAHKLVHLQSNTRELARFLLADNNIDYWEHSENKEEEEDKYISRLAELVEADVHGQLIEHPWVVKHVRNLLKKHWTRLATAGAAQFHSAMTMPDDSLPDNTVCIPHLPEGDVIVFPYPCRWKWDIKVWQNRHTGVWSKGYEGIIAGNTATMLSLGRDFDGDFLQFLPASMLPNVASSAVAFGEPPALSKPKKEKVSGTLAEIAVRSMDNGVGLITYAIAKAWAVGNHGCIPRLAQELQIEVDSLKNVQRADREYIQGVLKAMGNQEVPWLKDHKEPDVFAGRPIHANGNDSISRLATVVNGIWEQVAFKQRNLVEFRDLFPTAPQSWEAKARQRRDEYQQKMKNASSDFNQFGPIIDGLIELAAAVPDQHKMTAASAFWHVCHVQKSGTASMVFHMWMPQIKERLAQLIASKLTIVGTNYGDFAPPKAKGRVEQLPSLHSCFEGITLELTVVENEQYPGRLAVRCGSRHFGLLASDSWKPSIGSSMNATLHNQPGSVIALVTTAEVDF